MGDDRIRRGGGGVIHVDLSGAAFSAEQVRELVARIDAEVRDDRRWADRLLERFGLRRTRGGE